MSGVHRAALAIAVLLAALLAVGCGAARPAIRSGDLLFQDLDCGDLCDAIEGVTAGEDGLRLSHVGIAERTPDGRVWVIEAYGDVRRTPLDEFLARTGGRYVHGRVVARGGSRLAVGRSGDHLAAAALERARARLGAGYDDLFLHGDTRYYCSELVQVAFREANGGDELFPSAPMYFGDPSGERDAWWAIWEPYYRRLGQPVPAGEPGVNPAGIARSPWVEILHRP